MKLIDAKLCASCDEIVEVSVKECPSCLCSQFLILSRIIQPLPPREESELVRTIGKVYNDERT